MCKKTLTIILFLFLPFFLAAAPSSSEVKNELSRLLKQNEYKDISQKKTLTDSKEETTFNLIEELFGKEANQNITKFIESQIELVSAFIQEYRIIFLILLIFVVAFVLFTILKNTIFFTRYGKSVSINDRNDIAIEKQTKSSIKSLYDLALELFDKGRINESVITIYKAAVEYYYTHDYINRGNEYTNNMIMKKINSNPDFYNSFSKMTLLSEIALFSDQTIEKTECYDLFKSFKKIYLV
jgi:hypothetical protein